MATRSLTEVFLLMRNNALQNRNIYADPNDDRRALVSQDEIDIELGQPVKNRLPPAWIDGVDEIDFEITRIKTKVRELSVLHDRHLNRPTLDDSTEEEHSIQIQTQEITQMFIRAQNLVQRIAVNCNRQGNTDQEKILAKNVSSSLARTLQELSGDFRRSQSRYLQRMKNREDRAQQYLSSTTAPADLFNAAEDIDNYTGFTDAQEQMVLDHSNMILEREKEINHIVQSINELNMIFKDLALMVVDQGTIVDRIDYNMEQTSMRVEKGLEQLQKADKYQKKNRKVLMIVALTIIVSLLIIILIAVKS